MEDEACRMEDTGYRIEDGGLMIGDGYGVEVSLWWNASRVTKRCFVTFSAIMPSKRETLMN